MDAIFLFFQGLFSNFLLSPWFITLAVGLFVWWVFFSGDRD